MCDYFFFFYVLLRFVAHLRISLEGKVSPYYVSVRKNTKKIAKISTFDTNKIAYVRVISLFQLMKDGNCVLRGFVLYLSF